MEKINGFIIGLQYLLAIIFISIAMTYYKDSNSIIGSFVFWATIMIFMDWRKYLSKDSSKLVERLLSKLVKKLRSF